MKKKLIFILFFILLIRCSENDNNPTNTIISVSFNFVHHWDGIPINNNDFNSFQFTNANGEVISIERLRYLVSNFNLISTNQPFNSDAYYLIDVGQDENLSFIVAQDITAGSYSAISFTFGFSNENNIDGAYTDLNSANFNVPVILGGGYHYMQFDGEYLDSNDEEQPFNYHTIRAVDNPGANPTFPQDTFFEVNLGSLNLTQDTTIDVNVNISEWFKNPHTWDLNVLNTVLMPNSSAQILMYDNGQNVFSLE